MKDPVIAIERQLDTITIDGNIFKAYITIGLAEYGDFYLKLEFNGAQDDVLPVIGRLSNVPKALAFSSDIAKREGYNIRFIVVEKVSVGADLVAVWECLSDEPFDLN